MRRHSIHCYYSAAHAQAFPPPRPQSTSQRVAAPAPLADLAASCTHAARRPKSTRQARASVKPLFCACPPVCFVVRPPCRAPWSRCHCRCFARSRADGPIGTFFGATRYETCRTFSNLSEGASGSRRVGRHDHARRGCVLRCLFMQGGVELAGAHPCIQSTASRPSFHSPSRLSTSAVLDTKGARAERIPQLRGNHASCVERESEAH